MMHPERATRVRGRTLEAVCRTIPEVGSDLRISIRF